MRLHCALASVIALILGAAAPASATVIEFQATDVADTVAGEDRWMYEYFVSDFVFDVDQGFSVYFTPDTYANLAAGPVTPDWDVITIQPDTTLPSRGFYDALAFASGASLTDAFALTFTWLGAPGTAPGSQLFTVNQFDAAGDVTHIETGQTVARATSVPEPSTIVLVGLGLAMAYRARVRSVS